MTAGTGGRPMSLSHGFLPAGPLRDLVAGLIAIERCTYDGGGVSPGCYPTHGGPIDRVARRLGVTQRDVWRLLHEQQVVSFDLADRIVTAEGSRSMLDLWPDDYWTCGLHDDARRRTTAGV